MTAITIFVAFVAGAVLRTRLAHTVRRLATYAAQPPRNRKLPRTRDEDLTSRA